MTTNKITINAHYQFHSRLKGELEVQLFNDFYLQVTTGNKGKQRQFKLEVATLNPEAKKYEDIATPWLVPAVITGLVAALFLFAWFTATESGYSLIGALLSASMSALFIALFYYNSERKWVIEGRHSHYPLIELPYHKRQHKEADEFIKRVQKAIADNIQKKRYTDDDLFAGELRMLRRLSQKRMISDLRYNQAKRYMMKRHGSS